MKFKSFIILISITAVCLTGCSSKLIKWQDNPPVYPIGETPTIGYKTSMVPKYEKILFEANPILRLPLFNSYARNFANPYRGDDSVSLKHANAVYISYRPQLRMFTDNSKPVRTPSSKISIVGYQHSWNWSNEVTNSTKLLSLALESGHYSNGQDRSAFNEDIEDQTKKNDSIYNLITDQTDLSSILNRKSGNFSTNYTELIIDYRCYPKLDENSKPTRYLAFKGGVNVYHNWLLHVADIGGYSQNDIKIYGRARILFGVESMKRIKPNWFKVDRLTAALNSEYITNPHPSVQPWRGELTGTAYFQNNMGIFLGVIMGHDNYNYRFVDSGFQFSIGLMFDIFPPITMH